MDKYGRLTKLAEWRIGAFYCWAKYGKAEGESMQCIDVNQKDGSVLMATTVRPRGVLRVKWRNQFKEV